MFVWMGVPGEDTGLFWMESSRREVFIGGELTEKMPSIVF